MFRYIRFSSLRSGLSGRGFFMAALLAAFAGPGQAALIVSSDLFLTFQQDGFPAPPPVTATGVFDATVSQQRYEQYTIKGSLQSTTVGPTTAVKLTDTEFTCEVEFCDALTVTSFFTINLLEQGTGFQRLLVLISGEYAGQLAPFRVKVDGALGTILFSESETFLLDDGESFSVPVAQMNVSSTQPGGPPVPVLLTGQMSFEVVEGLQRGDTVTLPSSLDLLVSEAPAPVPEPGTMMLLGLGLVGLAGYGRRKRL